EGLDASAALFNVRGETIAQAAAIPIHLGCLELAAKRLVRAFPPDTMAEGDAFLLNDPYDGGTHLPDITLAIPIFAAGRPVALACTMCHHQDVGGRTPGSVPTDATELFQEGLIIPPTRLFRQGVLDENRFGVLRRNVRIPEVFAGDLMAQVAAGRLGGVRLGELFGRYGTAEVLAYVETLLDRAETLTRLGIEAIPDGTYAFQDWLDDDVRLHRHQPAGAGPLQRRARLDALRRLLRGAGDLRPGDPRQRRLLPGAGRRAAPGEPGEPAAAGAGELPHRDDQAHRRHDPGRAGPGAARAHPGGQLGHAPRHGVRGRRPRHRAAVRGERAGGRRHGCPSGQGRDRRRRDRRDKLHEHPRRGA